jgi:hypothetical protein
MYQIRSQLACVLILVFSYSQSLMAADPKPIQFASTLEPSCISGTQEVELNLGDQLCSDLLEVEWVVSNPLDTPFEWPRSTSSCGCISSVPTKFAIEAANNDSQPGSNTVRFKIKLPAKPETLTRQIVFWDEGGTAHLCANIKSLVIPHIRLQSKTITISDDTTIRKTIAVTASNDGVDLEKLQLIVTGPELVSFSFQADDHKTGSLQLELDPKAGIADATQSELIIEIQQLGIKCSQESLTLYFVHRTTVVPKSPIFVAQNDEYRSQIIIRSPGLIAALSDNETLEAFVIDNRSASTKRIPLFVNQSSPEPISDRSFCKLSITLSVSSKPVEFVPARLLLRCGKWEHELPCLFQ